MKKLNLLLVVALIVLSSCTSSERKYTTQTYSMLGKEFVDTVYIPESVIIRPDSDGSYRPYTVEVNFAESYNAYIMFKCGSFYVTSIQDSPYVGLKNFVLYLPHTVTKSGWEFYNNILKDCIDSVNGNIWINFKYISDIYMHGEYKEPYLYQKRFMK